MRRIWVVARRELVARRMLVPVALGLGMLPLAAQLFVDGTHGIELGMDGWLGGWCLVLATAFLIGVSLIGPELHDGRLRFYFSRPISAWQIFAGKALAGALLTLVVAVLLVSPARWVLRPSTFAAFGNLADDARLAMLCLALGLAFGVVMRMRSLWLLADLAGLSLVVLAIIRFVDRVDPDRRFPFPRGAILPGWNRAVMWARWDYLTRVEDLVAIATVAAVVALLAGGAAAVVFGRTDRRRAHAALSATLWPIALPAAGVMVACAQWWL